MAEKTYEEAMARLDEIINLLELKFLRKIS